MPLEQEVQVSEKTFHDDSMYCQRKRDDTGFETNKMKNVVSIKHDFKFYINLRKSKARYLHPKRFRDNLVLIRFSCNDHFHHNNPHDCMMQIHAESQKHVSFVKQS